MANKIVDKLTASSLMKAPEFMVCGVVLSSRLTVEEYAQLEDYEAAHDLAGLRVKLEAVQEQNNKNNRDNTTPAYRAQVQKVAALTVSRESKLDQLKRNPLDWDDDDDAFLEKLETRLSEAQDKLDTLKPDSKKILESATKSQKELNDFNHAYRNFYPEYVHSLATSRGLTKEKFDKWAERATAQDKANAGGVVQKGKALFNHSEEPQTYVAPLNTMKN